jgi:CheY-like chemotaxis protein
MRPAVVVGLSFEVHRLAITFCFSEILVRCLAQVAYRIRWSSPTVFNQLFSTRRENTVGAMPRTARTSSVLSSPPNAVAVWRSKSAVSVARERSLKRPVHSGRATLLWIDDYKLGLELYRAMFENLGYKVLTATSGEEGLKLAAIAVVDVVVTDYEMPGMNGEAVAAAIKAVNPDLPVILFSGSTLVPPHVRRRVDAFCDKAGSRNQLSATIERVLRKKRSTTLQPPTVATASHHGHRTVA